MASPKPSKMKAVVTTGNGKSILKLDVPVPKPGPGQVLIKVIAAAQNPSEWMMLSRYPTTDIVIGYDFAGLVEDIGPDVPPGLRKVGERVAGFVAAAVTEGGSFAEYCVTDAHILIPIPNDLGFEEASGISMAGLTACQALWQNQDLPTPLNPIAQPFPILIWGGATAVGQYAIQLAKLSGLQVIATASPRNHGLLRSFGADAIFDYRDPDVSAKIIEFTGNKLAHAIDCISQGDSPALVSASMGKDGGYVALVLKADMPRADVKGDFTLVMTLFGKGFDIPWPYPAIPEHYELGKKFVAIMSQLLFEGKLKTTPIKLIPNGLQNVQEWIEYQQEGKVSAEKITYRISDTP